MDKGDHQTLAKLAHSLIPTTFEDLPQRANAEDLDLHSRSPIAWGLIRGFRMIFVAAWVLSMVVVSTLGFGQDRRADLLHSCSILLQS